MLPQLLVLTNLSKQQFHNHKMMIYRFNAV
jgi:hypothetical protein